MPEIIIENLNDRSVKSNSASENVLKHLHENMIDWMHACGGKGRCTTCKMIVINGVQNLSVKSDFEEKVTRIGQLAQNERLACQCRLSEGEIVIRVPEENKLPHLTYTD